MSDDAQRDYTFWDSAEDGHNSPPMECEDDACSPSRKPIQTYSRRSSFINQIRTHSKWAASHADDDLVPPTPEAQASAIFVINNLPEGCLNFRLAISHCGEINLFFGKEQSPTQLLIDEDGLLSYFGMFGETRFAASDSRPEDFPYMQLLRLLGSV